MNISDFIDLLLQHSPALIVAVPLLGAFLTPLISRINDKARNIFVILTLGFTMFLVFLLASNVFSGNIYTYIFGAQDISLPVVRILFEVDAISIFMAIISIVLSLVAAIYSWSFMKENTGLDKFYTLILLMTAGMLGMELTGDMFNFFVFLEITSISSAALIAFWTNKAKSVEAGFKYIVISSIAAIFVLFSVALFYGQYNALNIAVIANAIQYNFLDKIALILLIAALAMKAGVVPMHMWLPDAYGRAPSAVTLVLIGATQASLYGVFRVCFTIYGNVINLNTISIGWVLVVLGIITMLVGVVMAIIQTDLKRLIAFAAVGEIGYMLLGIGAGLVSLISPEMAASGFEAMKGGIFHIMNDAFDIGLLFLVAGAIYYATKETSINKLGGLARNMKYTTIFFIIGLLAVSGIPPMNGFASKLLIYESTYQLNPILAIIAILSSIMLLAIFVKIFHSAFLGPSLKKYSNVKEVPKSMLISMGIISAIIIIFGIFPEFIINNIVEPAANALINHSEYISQVISLGGA
jgi:multicomponent Na+:H+ antiporter subunit D